MPVPPLSALGKRQCECHGAMVLASARLCRASMGVVVDATGWSDGVEGVVIGPRLNTTHVLNRCPQNRLSHLYEAHLSAARKHKDAHGLTENEVTRMQGYEASSAHDFVPVSDEPALIIIMKRAPAPARSDGSVTCRHQRRSTTTKLKARCPRQKKGFAHSRTSACTWSARGR